MIAMFGRQDHLLRIRRQLRRQPVVGLLGPRQIGKTTMARAIAAESGRATTYFDLEDPPILGAWTITLSGAGEPRGPGQTCD